MAAIISILILIICFLLALVVLAQNPKGGGLASGFTGAQQIGGVQRTADFLEKGTWTMAAALMVLCLISTAVRPDAVVIDDLSDQIEAAPTAAPVDPSTVDPAPQEDASGGDAPAADPS
jgi:preprotein translocase subunit SecG